MHTAKLRKVGGSVMVAIPPTLLQQLSLEPQDEVGVGMENGRIVIDPRPAKRFTLAELLAACDSAAPPPEDDDDWTRDGAVGEELL